MNINWKVAQDQASVLFYRTTDWEGLKLVHWRVRAGELVETTFDHHEISLPLTGQFTTTKQTATGRRQITHRTPDGMCLVPSGQPVSIDWSDYSECLTIAVEPGLVNRAASESAYAGQVELKEIYDQSDPLIWQIGLALLAESEAKEPVGRLYAESLASTLAFHLLRHYNTGERLPIASVGGLTGRKLRLATDFINAHLADDLTLVDIATTVDLSPFHFSRAFKRTTGLTPQQYLVQRRIERAKDLLAKDDLPIVEISAQVGFKNQSHFTTFFRRYTSMTPKVWRNTKFA
ncbi:MAG: helix-turn-helix transcriptional regulator [Blastocatellia bacterium]|nr:helix-turn-helix transcriptional regulator [Blastocatellia bacterium]